MRGLTLCNKITHCTLRGKGGGLGQHSKFKHKLYILIFFLIFFGILKNNVQTNIRLHKQKHGQFPCKNPGGTILEKLFICSVKI